VAALANVLIQLLPYAIGSMMMPTWILLVLSLLRSEQGQKGAAAFAGGVTAVRLVQGIVFGALISVADVSHRPGEVEIIVSLLKLVAGILMWAAALQQIVTRGDPDEPDGLITKWITLISALTPIRAFGLGALLVTTSARAWLFTLTALGVIRQAETAVVGSVVAYALYVLAAEALLLTPILVNRWAPERFDVLSGWIKVRGRFITIAVSLLVGGFLIWNGASGLLD
jgi:hypothetical protein